MKQEENELKWFLHRILQEIMKKNDTWNMRRLVDLSFVPATQQRCVLYWRLSNFKSILYKDSSGIWSYKHIF